MGKRQRLYYTGNLKKKQQGHMRKRMSLLDRVVEILLFFYAERRTAYRKT